MGHMLWPAPTSWKKYLYSTRMFYILLCVWINFGFCTTKSQSILFLELKCTFCSKFWVWNPMLFLSLTLKSAYVSKFCVWSCHFFPTTTLQYGWKILPFTAQHTISWCITSCNYYIIGLNHLSQYILLHHSENPLNHWMDMCQYNWH